ncbi:neuropeptide S receptor 1 [Phyllostomus discolor]|uniref:Neuropeptide S receptor 1 n=1 Tax=Phyllostomus discolor TaxID=89673 RepID=A0A833Z211_9CHIR|nr:neuropeptide S receptor 1 [Phyllostomus discolor]
MEIETSRADATLLRNHRQLITFIPMHGLERHLRHCDPNHLDQEQGPRDSDLQLLSNGPAGVQSRWQSEKPAHSLCRTHKWNSLRFLSGIPAQQLRSWLGDGLPGGVSTPAGRLGSRDLSHN